MLKLLDILLTVLHIAVIVFNTFGWIWKRLRTIHLMVLGATCASWFIIGIWYGWGYCFLTDWHWKIKLRLGEKSLPASFIKYVADRVTGLDFSPQLVDRWTLIIFVASILATGFVHGLTKKTNGIRG